MSQRDLVVMTDASLITCVLQRGKADAVVSAARGAGVQGATIHYGRGTGVRERLGILGLTVEAEKEVITIVVANDQLDHIFEKIYLAGEIDTPGMGVIYVTQLEKVATYVPDEILQKLVK